VFKVGSVSLALAVMTLTAAPVASAQVAVDFESFVGRSFLGGGTVPVGNRLSDQLRTSGVLFRSQSDYVAVVDLGINHATSGRIGIGGVTSSGNLSYGAPITISFWDPARARSKGVTSLVEIRGDRIPTRGNMSMKVYDALGILLSTVTAVDAGGTMLRYEGSDIHRVELTSADANVAFDDLRFNTVTGSPADDDPNDPIDPGTPSTTVPEPSSLAMLCGGALMLGIAARRKRPMLHG
jgi:PEP-CTERM motif